jgi:hypothetical protein
MRFIADIDVGPGPGAATVSLSCADPGVEWSPVVRTLALVPDGKGSVMPLPPVAPPADAPHAPLCAGDAAVFQQELARFRARRADAAAAFGRYLFEVLLGDALWKAIVNLVPHDGLVELAIRCRVGPSYRPFERLPWELMQAGERPLIATRTPRVAITRVVAREPGSAPRRPPAVLDVPVRILFVLGAAASDPRIRAATEILGVLRSVEESDRLQARVIERATPRAVAAAVLEFRPHVVHFMCHGDLRDGRGYLELEPDEPGDLARCYADRLLDVLAPGSQPPPSIVVLGACRSAESADFDDLAPAQQPQDLGALPGRPLVLGSLGTELVAGGVPVVVGMAGRVADVAARLFSRRLEVSLLEGQPLISATADARRAPFVTPVGARSIDWAYPILVLDDSIPQDFTPVPLRGAAGPADLLSQWVTAFRTTPEKQPVFCGREVYVDAFDDLFARTGRGALFIYTRPEPDDRETNRMGKSRLVEQFVFRTLRAGHVPLLQRRGGDSAPLTLEGLLDELRKELTLTSGKLGLTIPPHRLMATLSRALRDPLADRSKAPASVLDAVAQALADAQRQEATGSVLGRERRKGLEALATELVDAGLSGLAACRAIQHDLWELARAFRERLSTLWQTESDEHRSAPVWLEQREQARAVLLLDNLDCLDESFVRALQDLLSQGGLGTPDAPIPVVATFTWDEGPSSRPLRDLVERPKPACRVMQLSPFAPGVDQVVYQRVLLHPFNDTLFAKLGISSKIPFAVADDGPADASEVEAFLTESLQGRPYRLGRDLYLAIFVAVHSGYFVQADDADVLRELERP